MTEIIFIDHSFDDVYLNLAFEETLLDAVSSKKLPPLVRVWQNPISIVMGISRRVNDDLFLDEIREDRVPIARRVSGGGTVYHDPGTVSYSFFFPWELVGPDAAPYKIDSSTIDPFLNIIINALETIGFESHKSGVSDIFIDDRKVSGNAQRRIKGAILHHGTLLIDVDISRMSRYLKIPPERKDIPHEKFVTSLKSLGKSLAPDDFKNVLKLTLLDMNHNIKICDTSRELNDLIEQSRKLSIETYMKDSWIFRR